MEVPVSVATTATASAVATPVSAATIKRRVQLIHPSTVAKHNTEASLWVIYKNRVYDVTEFAPDHPGGDDLILQFAGKDMGDIMEDITEHSHSESAFELLEEHFIGQLAHTEEEKTLSTNALKDGNPAYILPANDGVVVDADFKPTDTDVSDDYKKYHFLDLNEPLIMQVWNAKFDKQFYMKQVHSPRHLKEPARLFGPWYLEMFTRTSWYVVPLIWLPISLALFARSAYQFSQASILDNGRHGALDTAAQLASNALGNMTKSAYVQPSSPLDILTQQTTDASAALSSINVASVGLTFPCFALGIFVWTVLEYTMHRFLFHIDDWLPDRPVFLMLHFLLHGIHHYLPMDRLRLVMPPLLFTLLQYPFTQLAHAIFPTAMANGVISGAFFMYVGYDTMHYALHHTKLPEYVRKQKSWHMRHHFSDPDRFFGVTSRIWDLVFGTDQ